MKAEKTRIREVMRSQLRLMNSAERAEASRKICQAISALPQWLKARQPLLFCALDDEPDLAELLKSRWTRGLAVTLPRIEREETQLHSVLGARDLEQGRFGIWEPMKCCPTVKMAHVDLAIIPGRAFTPDGTRLGRGGGYYDQLMAHRQPGTTVIGVCFERQIVPTLPVEAHDIPVGQVIGF